MGHRWVCSGRNRAKDEDSNGQRSVTDIDDPSLDETDTVEVWAMLGSTCLNQGHRRILGGRALGGSRFRSRRIPVRTRVFRAIGAGMASLRTSDNLSHDVQ